ncbi:hypothetical protein [Actinoplanes nipponensis]|uniref:hypothetical protein n=1 Tax=Actinoplanes nipponensis TaxID=135950 RepID=UPI0035EBEC94
MVEGQRSAPRIRHGGPAKRLKVALGRLKDGSGETAVGFPAASSSGSPSPGRSPRRRFQQDLRRVSADTGRTCVFVTHSVDEAVFLGGRVVVLSARPGRVAPDRPIGLPRAGVAPDELRGLPAYAALRPEIGHAVRASATVPAGRGKAGTMAA